MSNLPPDGVNVYDFSAPPEEHQPSGYTHGHHFCTFSNRIIDGPDPDIKDKYGITSHTLFKMYGRGPKNTEEEEQCINFCYNHPLITITPIKPGIVDLHYGYADLCLTGWSNLIVKDPERLFNYTWYPH
jgi:hypothetical protein